MESEESQQKFDALRQIHTNNHHDDHDGGCGIDHSRNGTTQMDAATSSSQSCEIVHNDNDAKDPTPCDVEDGLGTSHSSISIAIGTPLSHGSRAKASDVEQVEACVVILADEDVANEAKPTECPSYDIESEPTQPVEASLDRGASPTKLLPATQHLVTRKRSALQSVGTTLVNAPLMAYRISRSCLAAVLRRCWIMLLILVGVFLFIFLMGRWQHAAAKKMPSTKELYQTGSVCGMQHVPRLRNITALPRHRAGKSADNPGAAADDNISFRTYDSSQDVAKAQNASIAHCGDCGRCSNPHDIKIYDDTKTTLFRDSLRCSKKSVLGGPGAVRGCLSDAVGFTEGCNDCWVDNVMCDVKKCLFVCMWYAMFNKVDDGAEQQALNECTHCDERRCGPAFLECAGANRRRSGIMSEFQRDDSAEVCREVEVGWWQDEILQETYRDQSS